MGRHDADRQGLPPDPPPARHCAWDRSRTHGAGPVAHRRRAGGRAGAQAMSTLLSIHGLTVTMPALDGSVTVVKEVDLELGRGESLGLVGESGCGKTTTLLAIMQLLPRGAEIRGGELLFDGCELTTMSSSARRRLLGRRIGVIWQDPLAALDPVMRVGPQIAEAVRAHSPVRRRAADARAKELMR